jgi:phosphate uptake regulator
MEEVEAMAKQLLTLQHLLAQKAIKVKKVKQEISDQKAIKVYVVKLVKQVRKEFLELQAHKDLLA